MEKVCNINKTINYEDGSFEIKFDGYGDDIDLSKAFEAIDEFMENNNYKDMLSTVIFFKTLLKDYDENLLDIYYKKNEILEHVIYSEHQLICYEKNSSTYEVQYSLYFNIFKFERKINNINAISSMTNNVSEIVNQIESLKKAKAICLDRDSKIIVEVYRLFYRENPDFSDKNINVKVQTMLCILASYGITLGDYSFELYEAEKMPLSFEISDMVSKFYPLGEISQIESNLKLSNYNTIIISIIGENIKEAIKDSNDKMDALMDISKTIYNVKYDFDSIDVEKVSESMQQNSKIVFEKIKLFRKIDTEIDKKLGIN